MKTYRTVLTILFLSFTSLALANHPQSNRFERVRLLAHELEEAAKHVHHQAEESAHHLSDPEEHALQRLHDLEKKAAHFHNEVEEDYQNPRHTEKDFRKLVETYYRALGAMNYLHSYNHIYRDFERVSDLMQQLMRLYGGYGYSYGHGYYGGRGYSPRSHYRPNFGFTFRWN